jgi:hypothetical protein
VNDVHQLSSSGTTKSSKSLMLLGNFVCCILPRGENLKKKLKKNWGHLLEPGFLRWDTMLKTENFCNLCWRISDVIILHQLIIEREWMMMGRLFHFKNFSVTSDPKINASALI